MSNNNITLPPFSSNVNIENIRSMLDQAAVEAVKDLTAEVSEQLFSETVDVRDIRTRAIASTTSVAPTPSGYTLPKTGEKDTSKKASKEPSEEELADRKMTHGETIHEAVDSDLLHPSDQLKAKNIMGEIASSNNVRREKALGAIRNLMKNRIEYQDAQKALEPFILAPALFDELRKTMKSDPKFKISDCRYHLKKWFKAHLGVAADKWSTPAQTRAAE